MKKRPKIPEQPIIDLSLDNLGSLDKFEGAEQFTHPEKLILNLLLLRKVGSGISVRIRKICKNHDDPETNIKLFTLFGMQEETKQTMKEQLENTAIHMGISAERFNELVEFIMVNETRF